MTAERDLKAELAASKKEEQDKKLVIVRPSKLAKDGITGVVAQGTYEKAEPNRFNKEKKDFYIRAEDGTLYIINGTQSLEEQMGLIAGEEGKVTLEVSYNGKILTKSGRSLHDFSVKVK